jgi:hypothetical protein
MRQGLFSRIALANVLLQMGGLVEDPKEEAASALRYAAADDDLPR